MFMYSQQIFEVMIKEERRQERILIVDIISTRITYRQFEIGRVRSVRGVKHSVGGLNKLKGNCSLVRLLASFVDETPVAEWIDRDIHAVILA